jgi:hypothetical protein
MDISVSIYCFHQRAILRAESVSNLALILKCFTALESAGWR